MARKSTNNQLHKAKKNKSDEFYTQLCDIERELKHYKQYFKDKIVYCNCDHPSKSNFVRFFVEHFKELGLKKLIASCKNPETVNLFHQLDECKGLTYEYTLEDAEKGVKFPLFGTRMDDNGDFFGEQSLLRMHEADIIVTNPPFSNFRAYLRLIVHNNKKFLIIATINALTYKDVFNLIKENSIWLGMNFGRGISGFIVPPEYELYGTETNIDSNGNKIIATNNCLWLTNLPTPNRTAQIFLRYKYVDNERKYPKYDNCDAINIDKTDLIPYDYEGLMGVPITFLHKYNPEQFEIIKFRKGDDGKDLCINGKCPYFRVLIRNKNPNVQESQPNLFTDSSRLPLSGNPFLY